MVCLSWLLVVMMAYVCVPGFGSACWDSSICSDMSSKGSKLPDCIRLCKSVLQTKLPDLSESALKVNDNDLLLSILLASLVPENEISESDVTAHDDERRSYSMEHFRWGKPSGRKRRPVKVFASSQEEEGSYEGNFRPRRHLNSREDQANGGPTGESNQNQGLQRPRAASKSQVSPHERKDGTYRMNHFRWGSPQVSKRNPNFIKAWERKRLRQLDKLFRNITVKDVQGIMG